MHSNPPARGGWDRSVAGCRVRIMVCDTARRPGVGIAMHVPASCFHAPMTSVSRCSRIRWLPRLRTRLPDDAEESLDIDRLGKMVIETGSSESPLVYLLPCGRQGDHANARAPRLIADS